MLLPSEGHCFRKELGEILRLAVPLGLQNLFAYSLSIVSVLFIARLGVDKLAAAVMGTSLFNITGMAIVIGLCGAMETLAGAAYGAGNYRMVGIVLQRAAVICVAASAVIAVSWTQSERVLIALGQEPETARLAAQFLLSISPALFFVSVTETIKRYLASQSVVVPIAIVMAATCLFSPLAFWATTQWHRGGLPGAATALVSCQGISAVMMLIAVVTFVIRLPARDAKREVWSGLSVEAFQDWGAYFKLAVPSAAMLCLEWWTFEILTLLAGLLPDPKGSLAVVGVCIQVISIAYMPPLGICAATTTRISNHLGAGNARGARAAAYCSVCLTILTLAAYTAVYLPSRPAIARLFLPHTAADSETFRQLVDCLGIIAVGNFGDWINCSMNGVFRGCGRQELAAKINIVTYWGIGMGLLWTLAFKAGLGVRGLWMAIAIVTTIQAVAVLFVLTRIDWQEEARRTSRLVESQSGGDLAGVDLLGSRTDEQEALTRPIKPNSPMVDDRTA